MAGLMEFDFWLYDGATNMIKSIMFGLEVYCYV